MTLIYDKHEGWLITCEKCGGEGTIERHGHSYLSDAAECFECDGAKHFPADLSDFEDKTVRLTNGIVATVGLQEFFDMDGNAIGVADVDDIAAVVEGVAA